MTKSIVILSGWRLSGSKYQPLVKELKRLGFNVLAPDLPGFGKSSTLTKPLTLNDYVLFVTSFINRSKLNKVAIIGHSFGGRVGIRLTCRHPQLVSHLILTGTPAIRQMSKLKILLFWTLAKVGKAITSLVGLSRFQSSLRHFIYRLSGSMDYYKTQGHLRETLQQVVSDDLGRDLSSITIPTLLLWGRQDQIVPMSIGQKMAKIIPQATFISIDHSGHELPYKNSATFALAVADFIKKN